MGNVQSKSRASHFFIYHFFPRQAAFMFFGSCWPLRSQSSGGDSNELWLLMISQPANHWWCPHLFVLSHIWLSVRRRSDKEAERSCGRLLPAGRPAKLCSRSVVETAQRETRSLNIASGLSMGPLFGGVGGGTPLSVTMYVCGHM